MAAELTLLDLRTRKEWREWLVTHHASSPGVWLLRHKQHTAVASMDYEDLVREALCFGWIDSLIKRLDPTRRSNRRRAKDGSASRSNCSRRKRNLA